MLAQSGDPRNCKSLILVGLPRIEIGPRAAPCTPCARFALTDRHTDPATTREIQHQGYRLINRSRWYLVNHTARQINLQAHSANQVALLIANAPADGDWHPVRGAFLSAAPYAHYTLIRRAAPDLTRRIPSSAPIPMPAPAGVSGSRGKPPVSPDGYTYSHAALLALPTDARARLERQITTLLDAALRVIGGEGETRTVEAACAQFSTHVTALALMQRMSAPQVTGDRSADLLREPVAINQPPVTDEDHLRALAGRLLGWYLPTGCGTVWRRDQFWSVALLKTASGRRLEVTFRRPFGGHVRSHPIGTRQEAEAQIRHLQDSYEQMLMAMAGPARREEGRRRGKSPRAV